jgi:hypothetical protein
MLLIVPIFFLLTTLWNVVWVVVPLARLTNPSLRRDLATTPCNASGHIAAELFLPVIVGAVPTMFLALWTAIGLAQRGTSGDRVPFLESFTFAFFVFVLPALTAFVVQLCSAWYLLFVGAVRGFRKNRQISASLCGGFAFVVSVTGPILWIFLLSLLVGSEVFGEGTPVMIVMFLVCIVTISGAIRAVRSAFRQLGSEFLDMDPHPPL